MELEQARAGEREHCVNLKSCKLDGGCVCCCDWAFYWKGREGTAVSHVIRKCCAHRLCSLVGWRYLKQLTAMPTSQIRAAEGTGYFLLALNLDLVPCHNRWLHSCFSSCSSSGWLAKQGWAWSHWEAGTEADVGPALM